MAYCVMAVMNAECYPAWSLDPDIASKDELLFAKFPPDAAGVKFKLFCFYLAIVFLLSNLRLPQTWNSPVSAFEVLKSQACITMP